MVSSATPVAAAAPAQTARADRYQVSVQEYITFRRDGLLVVRGLIGPDEIAELRQHTEDLMQGKLPEQKKQMTGVDPSQYSGTTIQGLEAPPAGLSPIEKAQYFLRIHMLHKKLEIHERFLLHPRVLDVLEALTGPDVSAIQSMLFLKPPGKPGQGWHQDSYYIPTHPDSLCAAWVAVDPCDEYNGAMWFAKGSQHDPLYPPSAASKHKNAVGHRELQGITYVDGVSDPDDSHNDLTKIANRYDQVLVIAQPGDVVFFGGHILHRSKQNVTRDRFRRSFVGHYFNARSFTQWGAGVSEEESAYGTQVMDPVTKMTNGSFILARGDTHLPFAKPRFGTPCAALLPAEERRKNSEYAMAMMADMQNGMMGEMQAAPDEDHDKNDDGQM
jgi:ectoine hydroxylase-related dioxygenase (phytanoyl-CoA dioxygenase family)